MCISIVLMVISWRATTKYGRKKKWNKWWVCAREHKNRPDRRVKEWEQTVFRIHSKDAYEVQGMDRISNNTFNRNDVCFIVLKARLNNCWFVTPVDQSEHLLVSIHSILYERSQYYIEMQFWPFTLAAPNGFNFSQSTLTVTRDKQLERIESYEFRHRITDTAH